MTDTKKEITDPFVCDKKKSIPKYLLELRRLKQSPSNKNEGKE